MKTAIVALPIETSGKQSKWTLITKEGDFVYHQKLDHSLSSSTLEELERVIPLAEKILGRKSGKMKWKKEQTGAGRWIARTEYR